MKNLSLIFVFVVACLSVNLHAQVRVSGVVLDEIGLPVPGVKVYVKKAPDLRTIANDTGYYELFLNPGEYELILSFPGYERKEEFLGVEYNDVHRVLQLSPLMVQDIQDVQASAKKSNPGRDIILKVVERRDTLNQWNYPHRTTMYSRATERIVKEEEKLSARQKRRQEEKELKRMEKLAKEKIEKGEVPDSLEYVVDSLMKIKNAPKDSDILRKMNMAEVSAVREYGPPRGVKETRTGFKQSGRTWNLYYTTSVKTNFNFFVNLMRWDDLHEMPITSPISGPGILSYKYRLVEQYEEEGQRISKIEIIPRMTSTSTLSGHIWVIDSLWMIQKLDLELNKGSLLYHDAFRVVQTYANYGDSMNVLTDQVLYYDIKEGDNISKGKTVTKFSKYEFNVEFPEKYFGRELAVTTQEAYEKDSTFWEANRDLELSEEEAKYIRVQDSIHLAHSQKHYLDSVDSAYNVITPFELILDGIGLRNREKLTRIFLPPILGLVQIGRPGGLRYGFNMGYYKSWKNRKQFQIRPNVSYGNLNNDVIGSVYTSYFYDPMHQGRVGLRVGEDFDFIRNYDAISTILFPNNYIKKTEIRVDYSRELVNGLYFDSEFEFSERRALPDDFNFLVDFETLFPDVPDIAPEEFETYQGSVASLFLRFVPFQKFMREPYRKVILGSKWPTLSVGYERAIPGMIGSDIDYEYIMFRLYQSFKLGTIGTSKYTISSGKFLSARQLYVVDYKFQRRSDPFIFSNPLYSFQDLRTNLPTNDIYYEGHFVHHDNGAIVNKIPFMKKTGIGVAFGGGTLYVPEYKYLHNELFGGVERNFRMFGEIFRFGLYGVATQGNQTKPTFTVKFGVSAVSRFSSDWDY